MKFVHIADMHFDTSFKQLNNSNLGTMRRLAQRNVFKKIINYIKENNVDYLFIAGDLYEHKYIRESTIEYINNLFKEIKNTKVYITPGNHDPYLKNSFYNTYKWNENVYIFNSNISKVTNEDANIYGYGFNDFYYTNSELENLTLDDKSKPNILITHGTLNGTNNTERQYNAIQKSTLDYIGFDYVALGHIHKNNYTENGKIVYPGSTISMGFDELGKHGMIVGTIENKKLETTFIDLDDSEFKAINLDVTETNSIENLLEEIKNLNLVKNNFYEIYLCGKRRFDLDMYNFKKLIEQENIIKLKDMTRIDYDFEKIAKERTLKGLFVKEILERINQESENTELLIKALEIGLEIL